MKQQIILIKICGMILEIIISNDENCHDWGGPTIHACKTCHQKALGYKKSLPKTHPDYLHYQPNDKNLYLNLVDMAQPLSPEFTHPIMLEAITFLNLKARDKRNSIKVHCNKGMSRSPSIVLLYLAIMGVISNEDYETASKEFLDKYPAYNPGNGIASYLRDNWSYLMSTDFLWGRNYGR